MYRWRVLLVVMLLGLLAACGSPQTAATPPTSSSAEPAQAGPTEPPAETTAAAAVSTDAAATPASAASVATGWSCGDRSRLGDELHIFSWADYIPAEDDNNLLAEFEEACGVSVTLDTFPSNEELAAKIRAGNSGYDLIVPSDYMIDILKREGRLLKLDRSLLPNLKNLDPQQMNLYFDPGNEYSIPYQYGLTGIAFDRTKVSPAPDSWAALFDPARLKPYANQTSMLDDERESVGAALRYLGFSYNSTNPDELARAKEVLLKQKALLSGYDSENVSSTLAAGEVVLAHAWNGAASLAREENPNIEWIVPKEGGVIWQDNLAIPADAPEPYTAQVFINNLLEAEIGARITEYTYYLTPNAAARELLSDEVRQLQFYPTDEMRARLEWIERQGDPALYADVWTEVKGE